VRLNMPAVKSYDEREEDWRQQHALLQMRPAGYVFVLWVTGIAAGLSLALAAFLALCGAPSATVEPLIGGVCCAGVAYSTREELRPEFRVRRWRIAKAVEKAAIVAAIFGGAYLIAAR
jgi:phosphate/sulfate permease